MNFLLLLINQLNVISLCSRGFGVESKRSSRRKDWRCCRNLPSWRARHTIVAANYLFQWRFVQRHSRWILLRLYVFDRLQKFVFFSEGISIESNIANAFNLRTFSDVVVQTVNPVDVALDSVEITFKDQYMGRSEMWRLKTFLVINHKSFYQLQMKSSLKFSTFRSTLACI